jgi:hypothetical protein
VAFGLTFAVAVTGVGGWAVAHRRHQSGTTVERAAKSVHDAKPVLLPTKIPAGWKAEPRAGSSFYAVTWTAPEGSSWVRLEIALPNLPLPDQATQQKTMSFRGDAKADYQVHGLDRYLVWSEHGTWHSHVGGQGSSAVPYELTGHDLDESQFFSIAKSLVKVS